MVAAALSTRCGTVGISARLAMIQNAKFLASVLAMECPAAGMTHMGISNSGYRGYFLAICASWLARILTAFHDFSTDFGALVVIRVHGARQQSLMLATRKVFFHLLQALEWGYIILYIATRLPQKVKDYEKDIHTTVHHEGNDHNPMI
jgi:hypothetical protein